MKAGDKVWVQATFGGYDHDDYPRWRTMGPRTLPDHPCLPAVAAWLVEHGDALRYGQHTPGDWLDVVEATFDEQDDLVDRMVLLEHVVPALRALLAALNGGAA